MKKFLSITAATLVALTLLSSCRTIKFSLSEEKYELPARYVSSDYQAFKQVSDTNKMSIAVIPDSQAYVSYKSQIKSNPKYPVNYSDVYYRQLQFIADNSVQNGGAFDFAIHVGDHVDKNGSKKSEWKLAEKGLEILDNQIPFLTCIGNHDYDHWSMKNIVSGSKLYSKYFGPDSKFFKDKEWYGGATPDGSCSWAIFQGAGKDFLILSLELDPSDEKLAWGQQVIDDHKGMPTIYVTHSYLTWSKMKNSKQNGYASDRFTKTRPHNAPGDVWSKFISKNDQIFLILCGHSFSGDLGEGYRIQKNEAGHNTYSILSCYQARKDYLGYNGYSLEKPNDCGDGWMRIVDIDFENNSIHASTYSTEFTTYEKDDDSDFTLPIDWNWDERFPQSSLK